MGSAHRMLVLAWVAGIFLFQAASHTTASQCTQIRYGGKEFRILNEAPDNDNCEAKVTLERVSDGMKFCVAKNSHDSTKKPVECTEREDECFCGQINKDSSSDGARILNGEDVPAHRYPWLTAILFDCDEEGEKCNEVTAKCTSSIISKKAILTAAHCVCNSCRSEADIKDSTLFVVPGAHDISSGRRIKTRPIVHPEWFQKIKEPGGQLDDKFEFDIAILITENEMEFSKNLSPVCLPQPGEIKANGIVAGWGKTDRLGEWLSSRDIKYNGIKPKLGLNIILNGDEFRNYTVTKFPVLKNYLFVHEKVLSETDQGINITIIGDLIMAANATKDADKIKKEMFEEIMYDHDSIRNEVQQVFNKDSLDAWNIKRALPKYQNASDSVDMWFQKMQSFGNDLIFGLSPLVGTPKHASVGLEAHENCKTADLIEQLSGIPNMICNKKPTESVDDIPPGSICNGDSGGPAMIKTDAGYVILGVNSHNKLPYTEFMVQCSCDCQREKSAFYTDVRQHLDWIHDVLKNNSAQTTCARKT